MATGQDGWQHIQVEHWPKFSIFNGKARAVFFLVMVAILDGWLVHEIEWAGGLVVANARDIFMSKWQCVILTPCDWARALGVKKSSCPVCSEHILVWNSTNGHTHTTKCPSKLMHTHHTETFKHRSQKKAHSAHGHRTHTLYGTTTSGLQLVSMEREWASESTIPESCTFIPNGLFTLSVSGTPELGPEKMGCMI